MKVTLKTILWALLGCLLMFGLCACGDDLTNTEGPTSFEGELPEIIFGTWHPHPEVSDIPTQVNSDGTCSIDGQTFHWQVKDVSEDQVVLLAGEHGEYHLTFSQLTSPLPLLSESTYGMSVKEPKLWNYMVEWFDPNTCNAFGLDFEVLAQANCNIRLDNGIMTIEALDGETITHTIVFSGSEATVTDAQGNISVYIPIDRGNSGGNSNDPQAQYMQAMDNLQRVLAAGNTTTYADSNGEYTLSDSEALEKLYHVFASLQNHMDVSEQLKCIRKIDNVLVSLDRVVDGTVSRVMDYTYNSYGSRSAWWEVEEAITSGTQIYSCYDGSGNVTSIEVWGLVKGKPVYGADGNLTALTVTTSSTREEFTAPVTRDAKGNVVRIEIPFVEDSVSGVDENLSQVYEFLYDSNDRLVQYSDTRYSTGGAYESTFFYQEYGFYYKTITECYYDTAGKLVSTIEHSVEIGPHGVDFWNYAPAQYLYNADGLLTTKILTMGHIDIAGLPRDEMERLNSIQYSLFHPQGFVDSLKNQLSEKLGEALSEVKEIARFEYKYGSIYVYQTAE